jgi:hypothetical protein
MFEGTFHENRNRFARPAALESAQPSRIAWLIEGSRSMSLGMIASQLRYGGTAIITQPQRLVSRLTCRILSNVRDGPADDIRRNKSAEWKASSALK